MPTDNREILARDQRRKRDERRRGPDEIVIQTRVRCSGQLHRIALTRRGRLLLLDHQHDGVLAENVMEALTGEPCRCREVWQKCMDLFKATSNAADAWCQLAKINRRLRDRLTRAHWRHARREQVRQEDASAWKKAHDAKQRRQLNARIAAHGALRRASYLSRWRGRRSSVYIIGRGEQPLIEGRLCRHPTRHNATIATFGLKIDPVALLVVPTRLAAPGLDYYARRTIKDKRRTCMVLRVETRLTDEAVVLAGREIPSGLSGTTIGPVVETWRATVHLKRGTWRVSQWHHIESQ